MSKYKKGEIVKVKVTSVMPYGAFLEVGEGGEYKGLIHISEINGKFIKNIDKYLKPGENIEAKITDINEESKQIKFSLKGLNKFQLNNKNELKETRLGFSVLKKNMGIWIYNMKKEIENSKN